MALPVHRCEAKHRTRIIACIVASSLACCTKASRWRRFGCFAFVAAADVQIQPSNESAEVAPDVEVSATKGSLFAAGLS